MPFRDAIDSLKLASKNNFARWSHGIKEKDVDQHLALNRINSKYFIPYFKPKFKLNRDDSIFTMGSCFAREIESSLVNNNINVSNRFGDLENNGLFVKSSGVTTIYDFFNRYNVPSICSELNNISGRNNPFANDSLIYAIGDGLYDDLHYTAAAISCDLEMIKNRRNWLNENLAKSYKDAKVFIITLGLSEAWYDKLSGKYLNVLSSPKLIKKYNDRLIIKTIGFLEAEKYLRNALECLAIDGKKVILTVSPVPLQVTFMDSDVITENAISKSILRSLCQEMYTSFENVDYFPSYEMVIYSEYNLAWKSDGRHVQNGMVKTITSFALESYFE